MELVALTKDVFWAKLCNLLDVERILQNRPQFFEHRGIFLKQWSLDFDPYSQGIDLAPIGVCLPSLPIGFWDEQVLASIAQDIGQLVAIDPTTMQVQSGPCSNLCVSKPKQGTSKIDKANIKVCFMVPSF